MATKYTPLTTQTPMAVNNTKGIDDMLNVVNSLIGYHKQKADNAYTTQQREYQTGQQQLTLQNQAKEADVRKTYETLLTKPKTFTQQDVLSLASSGTLNQTEISRLMPLASDYIDQTDAMINFSAKLPELKTLDDFSAAVKATGLDKNTAFRMWNEQQQMDKITTTSGKGGGTGSGGGTPPAGDNKSLVSEAEGVNIKKAYKMQGRMNGNYNVYIRGEDKSPRALIRTNGNLYRKTKDKYEWCKDDGKLNWKDLDIEKSNNKPIVNSLNSAYQEFEDADLKRYGKSTSDYESRFK